MSLDCSNLVKAVPLIFVGSSAGACSLTAGVAVVGRAPAFSMTKNQKCGERSANKKTELPRHGWSVMAKLLRFTEQYLNVFSLSIVFIDIYNGKYAFWLKIGLF